MIAFNACSTTIFNQGTCIKLPSYSHCFAVHEDEVMTVACFQALKSALFTIKSIDIRQSFRLFHFGGVLLNPAVGLH